MEPLEKGVSLRRWGQRRRRGGGEEEESGPVPLRGLAVNQKALFIAGEEDKDTQREKVKDRREEGDWRDQDPSSCTKSAAKQTSQPATIAVRVPKPWVSFKNFSMEDSSRHRNAQENFQLWGSGFSIV